MEVTRAAVVANPATGYKNASHLLETCELIDVDEPILNWARGLVNERLRTLDAIHLASALDIRPDEFLAYDRRLLNAAEAAGLRTSSPGA